MTGIESEPILQAAANGIALICLLYQRANQFPTNRATLYERALRVLLEEWDASKDICREQLYKGLDTKRKELILAEIAHDAFVEDNLFFQTREITQQIEQLLKEMLPKETSIDGRAVLRSIEVQHGVLVERAQDIYSFSHLTLQEFLTAQSIYQEQFKVKKLVVNHLCDQRWREVFLLLAGLKNNANDLLSEMEKQIQTYINTPKLKDLLVWVEQITDTSEGGFKTVDKRAIALSFANANANVNVKDFAQDYNIYAYLKITGYTNAITNINFYASTNTNTNFYASTNAITNTNFYAITNTNTDFYTQAHAKASARDYLKFFNQLTEYACDLEKFQIFQGINFTKLIVKLEQLQAQIPDKNQSKNVHQAFTQEIIQTWLKAFDLSQEMIDLSTQEIKELDNYLYANLLMLKCKQEAVRVSPDVWKRIEERMLLPIAEAS